MARRNGGRSSQRTLTIPAELNAVIELYMIKRRIISTNEAIKALLETHPAIVQMASDLIEWEAVTTTSKIPEGN